MPYMSRLNKTKRRKAREYDLSASSLRSEKEGSVGECLKRSQKSEVSLVLKIIIFCLQDLGLVNTVLP